MDIDCVFSTLLYCKNPDVVNWLSPIRVLKCINNNYFMEFVI